MSSTAESPVSPPLCVVDDASFWAWNSWAKFEAWPDKDNTVVVVPVVGMADWGLGHPLDVEEMVLTHVLKDACLRTPEGRKPLVVPPLRFVFGADKSCAFPVDQPTALALIAEVVNSVAVAGFRRIVVMNSSPWNEEVCGAATRDLRVFKNLHMFQLHLSAIDLDFHPVRSRSRRKLQTLLTSLYGAEPEKSTESAPARATPSWGEETVTPLAGPAASLAEAQAEAPATLAAAAARIAKLLSDIRDREPLKYRTSA
jgi:creatinine amidohydrolase